jgi:metal-responsive CopG/Arc/MetJ family transcriptional regulator
MEQITLRVPIELKKELDGDADERGVSRSEYVREVLRTRRDTERLREQLESREARIDELEEQLAKRSQIESKIDTLASQQQVAQAPFFVRWYNYFRDRGEE